MYGALIVHLNNIQHVKLLGVYTLQDPPKIPGIRTLITCFIGSPGKKNLSKNMPILWEDDSHIFTPKPIPLRMAPPRVNKYRPEIGFRIPSVGISKSTRLDVEKWC